MLTIDCANCNNSIDDCAAICLHCGAKNKNRVVVSLFEAIQSKDQRRIDNIVSAMKQGQIVRII